MNLTTEQLEELLRLALTENKTLRNVLRSEQDARALEGREVDRLKTEAMRTAGRLYMDPNERSALAKDIVEAHVTLGLAAESLRRRNQTESNRCERLYNRMGEWVRKLKVMP